MRIGIDISQVVYGTGVSVYTKELVANLLKIDSEDRFVLFGGSLRRQSGLNSFTNNLKGEYEKKILYLSPSLLDLIWNRFHYLNVERLIGDVDVYHSSDWTQPPTNAFKVTTIHDLAPIKYAVETPKKIVEVHKRRLYWVLKEVDRIIVPTNFIRDELVGLGANENKIRVINEAPGEEFHKVDTTLIEETKRKFKIHDDYILSVGVGERKNTKRLIEAYEKSKKNYKLVIVGGSSLTSEVRGVIRTGYVTNNDLVALCSGAKALVYPSLYEGFGLPILQAMACGCPVVTSDVGSMKEVADKAAILVDPLDINSIAAGIEKAVNSPMTLSKKGLKRVENFSWKKAAMETLNVYGESLVK